MRAALPRKIKATFERLIGRCFSARSHTIRLFCLLIILPIATLGGAPMKKVLVFSDDIRHPANATIEQGIRETLLTDPSFQYEFFYENQDEEKIPGDKYDSILVTYLRSKYEGENFDLIFAVGATALGFLLEHEPELFSDAPKIFVTTDHRELANIKADPHIAGVSGRIDFASTLDLILEMQPKTKRLVVITGSAVREEFFLDQAKKQFSAYADKVDVSYLSKLSIPELQNAVSSLGSDTVVFIISYAKDPAGRAYSLGTALPLVEPYSSVPVYTSADIGMGKGAVGGNLLSFQALGIRAGEIGLRVLFGEKPSEIPPQTIPGSPVFDWRQLRRWNLDENSLPQGSIVRYREPTAWEQYKWQIIGIALFTISQTGLIGWLLFLRTRRKKAETESAGFAALARTEHKNRNEVVVNVPGIVWESQIEPKSGTPQVVFISDHVEKTLGYTPKEVTSIPEFWLSVVLEEDRRAMIEIRKEILGGGNGGLQQFRCVTKDGAIIWLSAHLAATRDEDGNLVGIRGVALDITDQKLVEHELHVHQLDLREAQRLSQIGNWEWDLSTGTVRWSDELYHLVGLDLSQPPPNFTKHPEFFTPESFDRLVAARKLAAESGVSYEHELEMIRTDGQHIWTNARGEVIRGDDGKIIKLRGTFQDVTARKDAERAVRESDARFTDMADTAPVLIWMADTEKRCTYFNQQWVDFTGRSLEQELGEGWTEGVHEDDLERRLDTYNSAFDLRTPFSMEYRLRNADGLFRWVYDVGSPRFGDAGEFLGYIGSCVDLSERKESEHALKDALNEVRNLQKQLQDENVYLREVIELEHNFDELIGHSDTLRYVLFKIEQVAKTETTVLITGETGTGKELVARAIHRTGLRKSKPLVVVNCAALSASLIESELFGHERGAFTGAIGRKIGRFELADGATIFLDEVGELPLELQAKLLRVIQEGEFERLGSSKTTKVDARIIAATNRNMEAEVRKGTFREDLLFRLNVFPITVPPLRERKEDLPELVAYFAARFAKKVGKEIRTIAPATIRRLTMHSWPGNVRELANVIERAVITSQGDVLSVFDEFATAKVDAIPTGSTDTLEVVERKHIRQVLINSDWKIEGPSGAAAVLGLNPSTLRTRMVKLGISKQQATGVASD